MKKLPWIILAIVVFLVSMKVSEAYAIDRGWYYGYFTNSYDSSGDNVIQNNANDGYNHYNSSTGGYDSIPPAVDTADEFIAFIRGKLNSTRVDYSTANNATNWDRTGAAFLVQTMIGTSRNRPPTAAELADWENRVRALANAGRVNWNTYVSAAPNTFYQINRSDGSSFLNDVAWYNATGSGQSIVFYDGSGNASYIIRRACANPIGNPVPIQASWSVVGSTTVSDNGTADPGDTPTRITSRPGDTITWSHRLYNNGPGQSYNWYASFGQTVPPGGWTAQYYNNLTLSGAPVVTRNEAEVFYHDAAGNVAPAPGVLADGFSARWTRTVNLPAGEYWFTSSEDDGARIYLDGVLILDDWSAHGTIQYTVIRNLAAGNHTIEYQYFEQGGPGHAQIDFNIQLVGGLEYGYMNSGTYGPTITRTQIIPLGTAPGTMFCQKVLWDWKNSWGNAGGQAGGGEIFNAAGTGFTTSGLGQQACATVASNYDLTPTINVQINGGSVSGNYAEPGDTITFIYAVNNTTNGASVGTACTYRQAIHTGYSTAAPGTAFTPAGATCPPPTNFPAATNTTTATESVTGSANTSLCRSITVTPAVPAGTSRTAQACAHIVAKPYARVYGGDMSMGGGLVTSPDAPASCSKNNGAASVGWNRGSGAGWAGAGAQFAAYAMSVIFNTSTALGNAGGTQAPKPNGLSFANTNSNSAVGNFGGSLGSVACMQDYYSTRPAATNALPASIGAGLASGSYSATGNVQLGGGTINPGTKVNIYVDGNLLINGNITYGGNGTWTSGNIPMLRLVVRGNIFIDNDVSQLDGLYVAQPSTTSNGIIYTCATTGTPFVPLPLGGTLASECDNQRLRVNGSLVARHIQLLRTVGTVRASSASELSTNGNIAESLNYTPALWISQPPDASGNAEYDAINTLPPVL